MINILETKIQRNIQLIDYLFSSQTDVSLDNLSEDLCVSSSTILNDIDYLNSTYSDSIHISKKNSKKIYLENTSSSKLNHVQYLILNHSKNVQLLTELLINPFFKVKDYSEMIGVSPSYIYKAIDQINISLSPYRIYIAKVNNKYFIECHSEVLLRKLFSIFLVETKSYTLEFLIKNNNELKVFQDNLSSDIFLNLNLFQPYYYAYFYLSTIRNQQGFQIKESQLSINDSIQSNYETNQIIESIQYSPYKNTQYFYNRNFYSLYDYLYKISNKNKKKAQLLFTLILRIYENEISYQVPPTLFLNKLNFFYWTLKEKRHLYNPVKKTINEISAIIRLDLNEYKVILSYILIVHFSDFLSFNQEKSILIVSKLSLYHADFLKSYFDNKFESYYNFIIVRDKEMIEKATPETIFITNDPSLKKENKIVINDYPTKVDIEHVKQEIGKLYF